MLKVTCAIIFKDNHVLIAQRCASMKLPLKWEFPGGKIEPGESKVACLVREIKEELNLDISIGEDLTDVIYHYPDFSLHLFPFICTYQGGELKAMEHSQVKWEKIANLMTYDWAGADVPVVKELMKLYQ
ncbi:(deoxy)nucleoside triphosphate pyrophosphohydrolase [Pedobacter agri]|uniref:(deoxy)nucleoside triphosphate pyrophosphohydrolase n=1 Tax=Pedobacter agri TaxID=454586 RepID=UPI000E270CE9|nr:(deoxy)nucleoside triphosphate pyrophosphohydrolase [Pedobacter agri]MDQ1140725.1 8-oxo-dGTP diphosphatase [Pedobacter agri]